MNALRKCLQSPWMAFLLIASGMLVGGRAYAAPAAHVLFNDGDNSYSPQTAGENCHLEESDDDKGGGQVKVKCDEGDREEGDSKDTEKEKGDQSEQDD